MMIGRKIINKIVTQCYLDKVKTSYKFKLGDSCLQLVARINNKGLYVDLKKEISKNGKMFYKKINTFIILEKHKDKYKLLTYNNEYEGVKTDAIDKVVIYLAMLKLERGIFR